MPQPYESSEMLRLQLDGRMQDLLCFIEPAELTQLVGGLDLGPEVSWMRGSRSFEPSKRGGVIVAAPFNMAKAHQCADLVRLSFENSLQMGFGLLKATHFSQPGRFIELLFAIH